MSANGNHRIARLIAFGFAAIPFCFGALRAFTTGSDFRYLVTALASVAAAWIAFRVSSARVPSRWGRSFLALVVSSVAGGLAAFAQGAKSVPAVAVVATAFGMCFTLGGMLGLFSRKAA
jgi:hypothetical protein